jgi:peroxiredoxin
MRWRFGALVCILCFGMLASAQRGSAQTEAARELKQVVSELRQQGASATADQYAGMAERALLDFSKKYPNAPEGALAHMYLGSVYASLGAYDNAVRQFDIYLHAPVEKKADEVAQARYLAASSYIALDRYDDAEETLKDLVDMGSKADPRILKMASTDLTRLSTLRKLKVGNPAIEISGVSSQGKRIKIADYRGKVVLLDFWAAWCMPCRMEMPNVVDVYQQFHEKGFEIVGVSLDSDKSQFESFVKTNRMTWPQIYEGKGWQSDIGRLYGVTSIPATFLIDKQGKIRYKNVRGEKLKIAVEELLKEA